MAKKLDDRRLARWSRQVRAMYYYRCVRCRSSLNTEAHHIYPKSIYPKKAYSLRNGVCLCRVCHREAEDSLHSMIELKDCNRRSLNLWLKKTKKKYRKPLFNSSFYLSIAILVFILWFVTHNP